MRERGEREREEEEEEEDIVRVMFFQQTKYNTGQCVWGGGCEAPQRVVENPMVQLKFSSSKQ